MSEMLSVSVIVLAAGEGKRMQSDLAKPLHPALGVPMVIHVINSCASLPISRTVVVVGHGAQQVRDVVTDSAPQWAHVCFAEQVVRDGTGGATIVGLSALESSMISAESSIIVMPGDTPLLRSETIAQLVQQHHRDSCSATVLSSVMDDATGYGRIIRNNDGDVIAIVEHRDANDDQRQILEVNTGIYVFRGDVLDSALRQISNDNAQSEYYLTDVIDILVKSGKRVGCVQAPADETAGVNDPDQLAFAESVLRDRAETALRSRAETALRARAEKGG